MANLKRLLGGKRKKQAKPARRRTHHSRLGLGRHRKAIGLALLVVVIAGAAALRFWHQERPARPAQTSAAVAVIPAAPPPAAPAPPASPAPAIVPPPSAAPVVPPAQSPVSQPSPQTPSTEPPWLKYATTVPDIGNLPRIAIVIDDCGLDRPGTEKAIDLPAGVTLSFMTYADDLAEQTAQARRHGHELIVHVPMQPLNPHIDMGPNGLAVGQSQQEVLRRLNWDLGRFSDYVGINNHMGSRFTADLQGMQWVIGILKERGLMFLDSRTIADSVGAKVAAADDVPYAVRDVFLDDDQKASAVDAQLREVEAVARKKGTAIAIGHPHPETMAALGPWIANLSHDGFVLVPLTEIVEAREHLE